MDGIGQLLGKTLTCVKVDRNGFLGDAIVFETECGKTYQMFHGQDCCEDVHIDDICGDVDDLIGSPVLMAEEATSSNEDPENAPRVGPNYAESWTWTFYKLATVKGYVTIRWYGSSNGYYSEGVEFSETGI